MAWGLAAAAGLSLAGTVLGTGASIKGNEDALKAQKKAAELELKQAKQRAKIEDRQTVKSIALADQQTVANQALTDRQAIGAIEIADRQQLAAFALTEQQAGIAAAEDRLALQSELQTSNLNAQQRATEIRRNLMSTLGTQRATLAARGVSNGSIPGLFEDEARAVSTDDTNTNQINRLQGQADAAAGNRSITSSLSNLRSSNLLTATQSREGALASLANDREGAGQQLSQIRERSAAELAMMRESTKVDLENRQAATKLGIQAAKDQTRYANTAALISGFTQIASLGYSAASQYQQTSPYSSGSAVQIARQPVQYTAPRQLTRGPYGMAVGV